MLRESVSIWIDRPPKAVFAVLSDVEKTALWHPAGVEERWTSDGPIGVGSTRVAHERVLGRSYETEATVTVYEPFRALGLASTTGPVPFDVAIQLEGADGGTRVMWTTTMRPTGAKRLIVPLAFRGFIRQLEKGLLNLKSLMESGRL